MVVYFSGTGNSRYAAKMLSELLEDELLDSAGYIKNCIAAELITGKPWVFCAPTYAWQIPRVFADFIKTGDFKGERRAYFVLTCGGETGNAAEHAKKLCEGAGLEFMGMLTLQMPENYVAMFSVPSEEKCAEMINRAGEALKKVADDIKARRAFTAKKIRFSDKLKSGPVNEGFYKYFVSAEKFYATDKCIGCGKCEKACVLNNITIKNGRPVWGSACTHCMACICGCPEEAIEYGKRSIGKRRYICPEYKADNKN